VDPSGVQELAASSVVADRLRKLKKATLGAIEKRESLPRVLFWSLFHSEVEQIRERRQLERQAKKAELYPFVSEDS